MASAQTGLAGVLADPFSRSFFSMGCNKARFDLEFSVSTLLLVLFYIVRLACLGFIHLSFD